MNPKKKLFEKAHQSVINSIFKELKKTNITIADSAQSALHKSIRECLSKNEENIGRLIEKQKKENQKIINDFAKKFKNVDRKVRRSFLQKIFDDICPLWPFCSE